MLYPSIAIDCSDKICSVAITDGENFWQLEDRAERAQARKILALIDAVLSESGLKKQQLKSICWAAGPGSFTGLRIATAVAQGMSYGLNIPLLAVSSLELMIAAVAADKPKAIYGKILAVSDARMGEVYWALFQLDRKSRKLQRCTEDSLGPVADIPELTDLCAAVGGGATLVELKDGCQILPENPARAKFIFDLAKQAFSKGKLVEAKEAEPLYLRSRSAWKIMENQ